MNKIYVFADGFAFRWESEADNALSLSQYLVAAMKDHGELISLLPAAASEVPAAASEVPAAALEVPAAAPEAPAAPKLPDSYPPAIRRLLAIQNQIKNLEAEARQTKDKLKDFMQKNNVPEIIGDGWKAEYKTYPKTTFDSKQFALDHAKLYKKYVITGTQTRLTVTATTVEGEEAV